MINIIGINEIPYADKKIMVRSACQMYKRFLSTKNFLDEKRKNGVELNDVIKDGNRKTFKSISLFETLLNLMSPDLAMIIKKEFIEEEKYDWWADKWSKSTYYKVKHEAIDQFLFLFYV